MKGFCSQIEYSVVLGDLPRPQLILSITYVMNITSVKTIYS